MAQKNNAMFNLEKNSTTIVVNVNGVPTKMIYSDYLKWKRKQTRIKNSAQTTTKVNVQHTEIKVLPTHITRLINGIKVIKSLSAYYDNGYRQWGKVAKTIISNPMISPSFVRFRAVAREIIAIQAEIAEIAKHNEKDVFQYIEKLSYKMDDAKHWMDELVKGVNESRVCEFYSDMECINGEGRRLGLRTLMMRTLYSLNDITKVFNELNLISRNGVDVLDYSSTNGKRITNK